MSEETGVRSHSDVCDLVDDVLDDAHQVSSPVGQARDAGDCLPDAATSVVAPGERRDAANVSVVCPGDGTWLVVDARGALVVARRDLVEHLAVADAHDGVTHAVPLEPSRDAGPAARVWFHALERCKRAACVCDLVDDVCDLAACVYLVAF